MSPIDLGAQIEEVETRKTAEARQRKSCSVGKLIAGAEELPAERRPKGGAAEIELYVSVESGVSAAVVSTTCSKNWPEWRFGRETLRTHRRGECSCYRVKA